MHEMKLILTQCKREMADSASAFCGPSLLPKFIFQVLAEIFDFDLPYFKQAHLLRYRTSTPLWGWHTLLIQFF